jgi:hypothetical protein
MLVSLNYLIYVFILKLTAAKSRLGLYCLFLPPFIFHKYRARQHQKFIES